MMGLIGLVHTTRLVIDPVHEAITAAIRDCSVNHVLDEGILRRLTTAGRITPEIVDWLTRMVASTESAGADLAVVSCSSLSPCVNEVRSRVAIPVLKVDEPMMEYALQNGSSIGLLMTNPTTEQPSQLLFREVSERLGAEAQLVPKLCSKAFAKLNSGDIEGHDREVVKGVETLLERTDLVLLAQISIARVRHSLAEGVRERVLSSLDFIGMKATEVLHDKPEV